MVLTWVVVCHRAGARILEHKGQALRLLEDVAHQTGRLKDRQVTSDRPGRGRDSRGPGSHGLGSETSPHDLDASGFARHIAELLEDGRQARRFQRLVLVAEPRFLGLVRGALDPITASLVTSTVGKDLAHVATTDLSGHLKSVLLV